MLRPVVGRKILLCIPTGDRRSESEICHFICAKVFSGSTFKIEVVG